MLSDLMAHGHAVRAVQPPRGPVGLHVMATGAGFEKRANEVYSWEGLKRGDAPFVVVQHTIAGRGELDYAGVRHALLPGSTMVLSFPHANRYWLDRGRSWEYFWIGANGRESLRLVKAVLDSRGPVLSLPAAAIDQMAAACVGLLQAPEPSSGLASGLAYLALMALYDGSFEPVRPDAEQVAPAMARTRGFILGHLDQPLDVDRLARVAGLSRAHFVRRFSVEMGRSPSAFVLQQRMALATRLLLATDRPITSIASAAGFANANYFAKAFRRQYGQSPGEFRRSAAEHS